MLPASSTSESCDTGRDIPGVSNFRGSSAPRRQNMNRGYRRGGRPRPQHKRVPPITEHLDKLSLLSDCGEEPAKGVSQGHRGDAAQQVEPEGCPFRSEVSLPAADNQLTQQALNPLEGLSGDSAPSAGSHGQRGRRRSGPHRHSTHTQGPGPTHCHWDPRPPRNRGGGPNSQHHRGRAPRRGLHHRVVDREGGVGEVL